MFIFQPENFKTLSSEEEKEFRQWARDNYCPAVDNPHAKEGLWHPTIIDECIKMKLEWNNPNNHDF